MKRREFITLLGGAATWPLVARAQQPAVPVIGFLRDTTADGSEYLVAALRKGLSEAGMIEGHDFLIEFGWANGDRTRLPALAQEFARRQVAVIVASATSATLAAKYATATTPIVFVFPGDPIELKLVASINRPGGNMTGVSYLNTELADKRVGMLHELAPAVSLFGVLINPNGANAASTLQDVEAAAAVLRLKIEVVKASTEREVDEAFASLGERKAGAVLVGNDSFFSSRREQITSRAAHYKLPAIYAQREFAEGGGLMSYGANLPDAYRLAGLYAARILKGENPAELPVLQPTKFEFVINLNTAKVLDLTVPPTLLALADEVIE
jgi:putative ABC transport system substrate-binding protein